MTLVIAGRWEHGYFDSLRELMFWEYVMRCYDLKVLAMTPISGIKVDSEDINVIEFATMEELLDHFSPFKRVFFESKKEGMKSISLSEFNHPTGDVIYIFGNAMTDNRSYCEMDDSVVHIDTPVDVAMMWGFHLLPMILQSRYEQGLVEVSDE